jgi:Big-like domain-containing protein
VAALALSPLVGLASAQADPAPTPTHGLDFDYFDEAYTNLGPNSVFETVTLERFKYILRDKPGNFAFFIGDPNDPNAQATIGHINDVAKDLGIPKIYNFTPKIDGGKWNLWNWNELEQVAGGNALAYWKNEGPTAAGTTAGNPNSYYSTHTDDYLNKDTTPEFVRSDGVIDGPYLFVYNKDRQVDVGGVPTDDHIVSSLSERKTAADLDTPGEVDAFEQDVEDVLGAVLPNDYATNSAFQFWKDEANRRHNTTYADANLYGGDILDASDNTDGWRVQPITYPEWIALLKHDGDIPFLFGGTWCHNTRAIVKSVNKFAQQYGVKKVYNFDYSLFSTSNSGGNYDHSRSSGQSITVGTGADTRLLYPSNVYGQTVNTYLTNATAEYGKVGQVGASPNYYYPDGDTTKPIENAVRIQVGHFLTYNKAHEDAAGNPAPVVDQALRQKDDGGNTEYMTEWWFVKGKDLPKSDGTWRGSAAVDSNALANQRAFAKEGIDDIEQVFRGFTNDLTSTTTVSGVGDEVVKGSPVTLDVSLTAAGYAPYLSVNTGSSSNAPGTLEAKPRGWVRLLDDEDAEVTRARLTRAGTAQFALPAQTVVGEHTYTVEYLGRGELIEPSSKVVTFDVVRPSTTTALAGDTSFVAGTAKDLTATVTPASASGDVTLQGLPGGTVTGTLAGGTATLTVPASVPAGTYQVKAVYAGDEDNATSESAPLTLTVAANQSTTTLAGPATTTFGAGGTFTATVTDGATGTARLLGLPAPVEGTISAGKATFALPTSLPVGSYQVRVQYLGDEQYAASESAVRTLTVGKATASLAATTPGSTYGSGAAVSVKATGVLGSVPTGTVTVTDGGTTVATGTLANGTAAFTLPAALAAGQHTLTLSYAGDGSYQSASQTVALTVAKGTAGATTFKPQGKVRAKKAGSATVAVATPAGLATPGGKVKVLITKGSAKKTVTGTLGSAGTVKVKLPKLAQGSWKVTVTYLGDATYRAGAPKVFKLAVKK